MSPAFTFRALLPEKPPGTTQRKRRSCRQVSRRTLDGAVAVGGGTWWRHGVLSIPATWGRGSSPSPSPRRKRAATVSHPTVEEVSRTRTARLGSKPSSFFPLKMWPNHFIPHMSLRDGTEAPVYINWGREETPHPKHPGGCLCLKHSRKGGTRGLLWQARD